jgi:hypothetical protein
MGSNYTLKGQALGKSKPVDNWTLRREFSVVSGTLSRFCDMVSWADWTEEHILLFLLNYGFYAIL